MNKKGGGRFFVSLSLAAQNVHKVKRRLDLVTGAAASLRMNTGVMMSLTEWIFMFGIVWLCWRLHVLQRDVTQLKTLLILFGSEAERFYEKQVNDTEEAASILWKLDNDLSEGERRDERASEDFYNRP